MSTPSPSSGSDPVLSVATFSSEGVNAESDAQYPIASITKTFTAALCLEPDLKDHLDRPFVEVMPYFRLQNEEATQQMTPRDALCHRSGLAPHTATWVGNSMSRKQYVTQVLPTLPVADDWREHHRYSNILYAVLGLWIEEITGETWESLIQSRVRDPLGLESLHVLEPGWEEVCPPPLALEQGELVEIPPFYSQKNHLISPASELRMSVSDLAKWGQHHLRLPADTERWRIHCPVSESPDHPERGPLSYGLGWRIDTVHGRMRVWHSGHCSGYTSLLSLYPNEGVGLAAAVNRSEAVEDLHQLELDLLHANQTL